MNTTEDRRIFAAGLVLPEGYELEEPVGKTAEKVTAAEPEVYMEGPEVMNVNVVYETPVTYYSEPRWMQWYGQYNNPYVVIGCGNMQSNGCVPTSAAMLLSAYGYSATPVDMGYYLNSTGNFNGTYGHGGTDQCWYDVANYAGLSAWGIYEYDSFVHALQDGAIVACHIYYGGGTHAVLATGYSDGQTMVYDPIGGKYWKSVSSLWNGQSYVWNDRLSGTSIIALK